MRIEIIKVPLAHPEQAAVVNRANIFTELKAAPIARAVAMRTRPR